MATGRHYATVWSTKRFRKYRVVRADVTRKPLLAGGTHGTHARISYTTVSRHWTYAAAAKESTRLNSTGGYAQ